jgi:hypothetical protein
MLADGTEREAILAELERLRTVLRECGRSDDEDIVLDAMDFLVGWCSPQMKL